MSAVPFQCFDPAPEVSPKEEAAYQNGYRAGVEFGRESMGLYLPIIADALRDLASYQEAYRKYLAIHLVDALQHILSRLVMPLPVAEEMVRARAAELFTQLDTNPTLRMTVANSQALTGHVPDFVTLHDDETLPATDFVLTWGGQATVTSSQEVMNARLAAWLAETLEFITTQKEITS